ncbi:sigma-70 family RNA polymerase sigma factor [Demequina sp. NBRC 110055]|uniref:sigma-70 family RNA polymerase sigma factor n=1 Tax=Demequina sp. NBRC 110055 TaxID=1570344 RepID=UPI000A03EE84|nr:sigma-70 family RNA polymerase sigma factor [Demequina sp. NBRC 110055]
MTTEAIALWTETSSDPELIAGVRAGDPAAFGVLYERHVDAARKVAYQYTNSTSDIDDVVSESFSRVLRALQRGDGPDLAFRAYLFTIVRRTGLDIINKANRTRPRDSMEPYEAALGYEASSDEPALQGFEETMVSDAYHSLPERWQAVLWYTEIEKKSPKEIAPLLGLSANGVAALAYRAREALRQAYLQQHLSSSVEVSCMEANAQLGAYVRGGLSKREHTRIDAHVKDCERCTALVLELEDVNRGLRGIIAPLFMGFIGVGALEGGLPVGGAFGSGASGAAASGSGAAATGAGGAASGAAAAGTGMLGGLGTLGAVGIFAKIAVPTAAAFGAVALTVAGVNFFGDLLDGNDDAATTEGRANLGDGAPSNESGSGGTAGSDDVVDTSDAAGADGATADLEAAGGASEVGPRARVAPVTASSTAAATGTAAAAAGGTSAPGGSTGAGSNPTDARTSGDDGEPDTTEPGTTEPDGSATGGAHGTDTGSETPATGTDDDTDPGAGTDVGSGTDTGTSGSTDGDGSATPDGSTDPGGDTDTGSGTDTGGDTDPGGTTDPGGGTTGTSRLTIAESPTSYLALTRSNPEMTLDLSNDGDGDAADVTASIALPAGLTFAAPGGASGFSAPQQHVWSQQMARVTQEPFTLDEWECTLSGDSRVLTCAIDSVGAGTGASLDMDVTLLTDSLADDATTTFTVDAGAQHVSYSVATGITDLPAGYGSTGGVGATQVGATLMGCSEVFDPHRYCKNVMSQTANGDQAKYNNNAYAMVPLNDAGGEYASGTTTLDLPAGATVMSATLEWSANRRVLTNWSGDTETARLRVPGGDYVDVMADTTRSFTRSLWHYYLSRADVTDLVTGGGSYNVADIALSSSPLGFNLYGGFTLTVIYDDPTAPESSSVTVFEGPHWASESTPVTLPFRLDEARYVTASWTAYETDRGFINDRMALDWSPLRPERERGTGDSGNAGDSTAFGGLYANTLGIDAKPFETVWAQQGAHTLKVTTTAADEHADDSLDAGQRSTGDDFLIGTVVVQTSTKR